MVHIDRGAGMTHLVRGVGSRAVLTPRAGKGDQGLPGPGAAAWTALQAVTTGAVRQAPDGSWIKSTGDRTTRASFDATEQGFWVATLDSSGTIESDALSASRAASGFDAWAVAVRPNRFDPVTGAYNFKASNTRRLRAGLGRAMTGGLSRQLAVGDSLTAGCVQGVALPYVYDRYGAWPYQMAAEVARHGVPVAGTGWVRWTDANLGSGPGWSYSGSGGVGPGSWLATKAYGYTTAPFDETRFVPGVDATALSLWWYDAGTGGGAYQWAVSIDGAAPGDDGYRSLSSTAGAAQWRRLTLIPDTPMTPSSEVLIAAGANGLYIAGAEAWNPDQGGLLVSNLGQSGSKASGTGADSWSDTDIAASPGGVFVNIGGTARTVTDAVVTNADATLTSATAAFDEARDVGQPLSVAPGAAGSTLPANTYIIAVNSATSVELSANALRSASGLSATIGLNPDCVHIALGVNDLAGGASVATTKAAIATIRNKFPDSDAILHIYGQPATSLVAAATFDAYVAALYDLADSLDVPLIDLRGRFGTNAQQAAQGLLGDSVVHMASAAYAEWGRAVGKVLVS